MCGVDSFRCIQKRNKPGITEVTEQIARIASTIICVNRRPRGICAISVPAKSEPNMPISEPEQKPSDPFHVVGFTEAEVKSGLISRSMGIAEEGFRTVAALGKKGSPLWQAAREDRVSKRMIEIYFLDLRSPTVADYPGMDRKQFRMLHFYNDTALDVITTIALELPPIISTTIRANMPAKLGVGVRDYFYVVCL